jgi:hypothetical protein
MQMSKRIAAPVLVAAALAIAPLAGCGGSDDGGDKATSEDTRQAEKPRATPIAPQDALAYENGTPRSKIRSALGEPLPVAEYAYTARDERDCDYYPVKKKSGVDYDNVIRFCFENDKLVSVGTAPSRENAGPQGEPSDPEDAPGLKKGDRRKGEPLPGGDGG